MILRIRPLRTLALAALAGLLSGGTARADKALPVDEGPSDASFAAFRSELLAAARRKDREFLLSALDLEVKSNLGGREIGIGAFRDHGRIDAPDSQVWYELIEVLTMGGSFFGPERDVFCAPYVFSAHPRDRVGWEHVVIVGDSVALREAPSWGSSIVSVLSYDIVTRDFWWPDGGHSGDRRSG